ncbi:MAG: hypothetical protein MZV64_34450 [Ignavibacteriales bacterium]|nr:hypothetical protein [Ignavibacteriales bacterium]
MWTHKLPTSGFSAGCCSIILPRELGSTPSTRAAPAERRAEAALANVAPVVITSSISSNFFPAIISGLGEKKAACTFLIRLRNRSIQPGEPCCVSSSGLFRSMECRSALTIPGPAAPTGYSLVSLCGFRAAAPAQSDRKSPASQVSEKVRRSNGANRRARSFRPWNLNS